MLHTIEPEYHTSSDDVLLHHAKHQQPPPSNSRQWPSSIRYLLTPDWSHVSQRTRKLAMRDRLARVKVVRPSTPATLSAAPATCQTHHVVAKGRFELGDVIGEVTGRVHIAIFSHVTQALDSNCSRQPDPAPAPAPPLLALSEMPSESLLLDISQCGNELGYIRQAPQAHQANVCFSITYIRKQPTIMCVAVRNIEHKQELLGDWNAIRVVYNSTLDVQHVCASQVVEPQASWSTRRYLHTNDWSSVPATIRKRHLRAKYLPCVEARCIADDAVVYNSSSGIAHPLRGQFGAFAHRDLQLGCVLGEYTGRVVEPEYTGSYVARLLPDEPSPGIDGERHGNELACLNDYRNIASNHSVVLSKTYINRYPAVVAVVVANVLAGQELLTDYGEKYWSPTGEKERGEATPDQPLLARDIEREAIRQQREAKRQLRLQRTQHTSLLGAA
jgi:hypothetical protein